MAASLQREMLDTRQAWKVIHATVGAALTEHGFPRDTSRGKRSTGPRLHARPRPDGYHTVFDIHGHAKWTYPGVARAFFVEGGVARFTDGRAPLMGQLRDAATQTLATLLVSEHLFEQIMQTHAAVMKRLHAVPPPAPGEYDGETVSRMIDGEPLDPFVRVPTAMWYRSEEDIHAWAAFVRAALPEAIERIDRASVEQRQTMHLCLEGDPRRR